MYIQWTQTNIWQICLITSIAYTIVISIFTFLLFHLILYRQFIILNGFRVVTTVELHNSSIKIKVFLTKNVLFVVTVRLNFPSLLLKLFISFIFQKESSFDPFCSFHLPICLSFLSSFSSQCSHLLNFNAFDIWNDLLMYSCRTRYSMSIIIKLLLSIKQLGKDKNTFFKHSGIVIILFVTILD